MIVLGAVPDLRHVLRVQAVHCDRVLVITYMRASHSHRSPHKILEYQSLYPLHHVGHLSHIVVGQLQSELGGGTETSEEDVLQVDERCPESAVVEGRHQGPREHVARSTQEGGEYVERVECGRQIPLTGRVSDRDAVHHVAWQT